MNCDKRYDEIKRRIYDEGALFVDSCDRVFALAEAEERRDADVLYRIGNAFDDEAHIKYVEKAAEFGSKEACDYLGKVYRDARFGVQNFETAYDYFLKAGKVSAIEIDVDVFDIMERDDHLIEKYLDNIWWLFLFKNHPTASLKYVFASLYINQHKTAYSYSALDRYIPDVETAIRLLEESAENGFGYSAIRLLEYYIEKDNLSKAQEWFVVADNLSMDMTNYLTVPGVETRRMREVMDIAAKGDSVVAAKICIAAFTGKGDGGMIPDFPRNTCNALHFWLIARKTKEGSDELKRSLPMLGQGDIDFLNNLDLLHAK